MAIAKTEFGGDRGDLFQLALKTGFFTLLTAGIYRFWATTRLRRWYWSSVRPGGMPLEYTGTALEKLIGFLFAIIVLAMLLTAVNLTGLTIAFDYIDNISVAPLLVVGLLALVIYPLWHLASYRARRYLLSRTRWRGIRMAMSPGGWGYAWRACMYGILNVASLGLLWPLKTFQLEKYLTDRSWYGTERFTQHGSLFKLYGPLMPFLLCIWGVLALNGYITWEANRLPGEFSNDSERMMVLMRNNTNAVWAFWCSIVLVPLTLLFGLYYRIASIRLLVSYKTLGDGVEFDIYPRTRTLIGIYVFGGLKTALAVSLVSPIVLGLFLGPLFLFIDVTPEMLQSPPAYLVTPITAVTTLVVLLTRSVFRQTLIVYPAVKHFAESFEIHNPSLVETVRQRDKDSRTDGGGFAEALGVGGAF